MQSLSILIQVNARGISMFNYAIFGDVAWGLINLMIDLDTNSFRGGYLS